MMRQVFRTDPKTGKPRHMWIDCGPRAAYTGHGRPLARPFGIGGGAKAGGRANSGSAS